MNDARHFLVIFHAAAGGQRAAWSRGDIILVVNVGAWLLQALHAFAFHSQRYSGEKVGIKLRKMKKIGPRESDN